MNGWRQPSHHRQARRKLCLLDPPRRLAWRAGWLCRPCRRGTGRRALRRCGPRRPAQMGFDDHAAHHMALLAMDQYGCALASRRAGLTVAPSLAAIRRVLRKGGVPVWSPTRMVLERNDVPASWDVTADSLAAWVAGKLAAGRILLVKQIEPPSDPSAQMILWRRASSIRPFRVSWRRAGPMLSLPARRNTRRRAPRSATDRRPVRGSPCADGAGVR